MFERILPERPTPERCIEAYYVQGTRFESIAERKLRRQLTEDGNVGSAGGTCANPSAGDCAAGRGSVSNRPRVCENAQEPTSWRIVFSIALFPIAATALFLFRLAKSRRIFYA